MKQLAKPNMQGIPLDIQKVFNQIFEGSKVGDIVDIGNSFTLDGTVTETTKLNVTSPTLANTNAVLATLILYLQRGGATSAN